MKIIRLSVADFEYELESPIFLDRYNVDKDIVGDGFRTKAGIWVSWFDSQFKEFSIRLENLNRHQIEKLEEAFLLCKENGGIYFEIINIIRENWNNDIDYENAYICDFTDPIEYEYDNETDTYKVTLKLLQTGYGYYGYGFFAGGEDLSDVLPQYSPETFLYIGTASGYIHKFAYEIGEEENITEVFNWQAFTDPTTFVVRFLDSTENYVIAASNPSADTDIALGCWDTIGNLIFTKQKSTVGNVNGLRLHPEIAKFYLTHDDPSSGFDRVRAYDMTGAFINEAAAFGDPSMNHVEIFTDRAPDNNLVVRVGLAAYRVLQGYTSDLVIDYDRSILHTAGYNNYAYDVKNDLAWTINGSISSNQVQKYTMAAVLVETISLTYNGIGAFEMPITNHQKYDATKWVYFYVRTAQRELYFRREGESIDTLINVGVSLINTISITREVIE